MKRKRQKTERKSDTPLVARKGEGAASALVARVRQLLNCGQLEQARIVLAKASRRHAAANENLLGWGWYYLALNQGEKAEDCVQNMLAHTPYDRKGLLLLVEIALKEKDIAQAANTISLALEKHPEDAEVLRYAGIIHWQAGNDADALMCFEAALAHEPNNLEILANVSSISIQKLNWPLARKHLETLCRLAPDNASAFLGLGTSCLRMGDYQDARQALLQALQLEPENITVMINLGATYRLTKENDNAFKILTTAVTKDPQNAEALAALSSLYVDMRNFAQGLEHAIQSVQYAPDNPDSYATCAYAHIKMGHYQEAEKMFRSALSLNPLHAQAGFGLGSILLLQGHLEQGWKYYRARFDVQQKWLDGPWPIWHGEPLAGKSLLIRTEQGLGDTIQFVRFLPLLQRLNVNKILMTCTPTLRHLFATFDEYVTFLPLELSVVAINADYQTALMELPSMLGINTTNDIPSECPYLFLNQKDIAKWRNRVNDYSEKRFTIGIIWAGNPKHTDDHNRSLTLRTISPLFELKNSCFFSLQLGNVVDDIHDFKENIVDLTGELKDFADTAAFMEALDFIVSVDTATVHLAGALNRPGAALLPFMPDWRWLLERNDSPWYPSLHLFRQPSPGDWQSVVSVLKEYLEQQINYQDR